MNCRKTFKITTLRPNEREMKYTGYLDTRATVDEKRFGPVDLARPCVLALI